MYDGGESVLKNTCEEVEYGENGQIPLFLLRAAAAAAAAGSCLAWLGGDGSAVLSVKRTDGQTDKWMSIRFDGAIAVRNCALTLCGGCRCCCCFVLVIALLLFLLVNVTVQWLSEWPIDDNDTTGRPRNDVS